MISLKHINKSYGSKKVLNNINLVFEKGKVYGIVGKNGAGKTTLFRCIAGIESCHGAIESTYENLKNHIGLLETNPIIMSRITGWEYLKLLCIARGIRDEEFDRQNIFELPLDLYASNYSTGMKKKLALLAVVLQKNDVFILDEPFNGVDIQSNIIILELINRLKEQDKTIIIASHIFSTLKEICDEIFLIKEGEIRNSVGPDKYAELEEEFKKEILDEKLGSLGL